MKVNLYMKQQGVSSPVLICKCACLWYVVMNKLHMNLFNDLLNYRDFLPA